jgi:hypothetical protein
MKAERYKFYEAEVRVKNKETLKHDANLNDGDIIIVQAGWLIDEEDGGPYVGQHAMLRDRGLWIPEEDLMLIREATLDEYYLKPTKKQPANSTHNSNNLK